MDRRALGVALAISVSQDLAYGLLFLSYMNGYLLNELKTGPGVPGYSLALYSGIVLITSPLAGRFLDRRAPRMVYMVALAFQLGATGLLLSVPTLGSFLIATALFAAGAGIAWPTLYTILARSQPEAERTRVTGILSLTGYLAMALGFGAGVFLTKVGISTYAFSVLGITIGAGGGIVFMTPLRALGPHTPNGVGVEPPTAFERNVPLFGAVAFGYCAVTGALAGGYGPYLINALGVSLSDAVVFAIPAAIAGILAVITVTVFYTGTNRPHAFIILFAIAAIGAFGMSVAQDLRFAAVAGIPLALGVGGIGPLVGATMLDIGNASARGGFIFGALLSVEGLGSIMGPAAMGTVMEVTDVRYGVAMIAMIFVILIGLIMTVPSRLRQEPQS